MNAKYVDNPFFQQFTGQPAEAGVNQCVRRREIRYRSATAGVTRLAEALAVSPRPGVLDGPAGYRLRVDFPATPAPNYPSRVPDLRVRAEALHVYGRQTAYTDDTAPRGSGPIGADDGRPRITPVCTRA